MRQEKQHYNLVARGPTLTLTHSVARIITNDQALFACRAEAAEASAIKETG